MIGNYKQFSWNNLREIDHLEDQGEEGRVILKRIFKKLGEGNGLDKYGSE